MPPPTTHGLMRPTIDGVIVLRLRISIPLCGFEKCISVSMPWEWNSRGNVMPLVIKKPLRNPKA